ncbi:MAG: DUF3990 domain-containing protein [Clostridiales bacterium]|nr:DUF3990 domain-containing protein [Clostridiales bacterium]
MAEITLYHASTEVIRSPRWNYQKDGMVKINKDFGEGFYTSPDREYPIMLYCMNNEVHLNKYSLDINGLKTLKLEDDVKWLLVTAFHRRDYSGLKKYHPLRDKVRGWVSGFDLVTGTISNDNFYSTMDAFIRNLLTDFIALNIVQMMGYGDQFVLKSEKACRQLRFVGSELISPEELVKYRALKTVGRENMEEMAENVRVRLHSSDNGKLFAHIVEEAQNNGTAWFG